LRRRRRGCEASGHGLCRCERRVGVSDGVSVPVTEVDSDPVPVPLPDILAEGVGSALADDVELGVPGCVALEDPLLCWLAVGLATWLNVGGCDEVAVWLGVTLEVRLGLDVTVARVDVVCEPVTDTVWVLDTVALVVRDQRTMPTESSSGKPQATQRSTESGVDDVAWLAVWLLDAVETCVLRLRRPWTTRPGSLSGC